MWYKCCKKNVDVTSLNISTAISLNILLAICFEMEL